MDGESSYESELDASVTSEEAVANVQDNINSKNKQRKRHRNVCQRFSLFNLKLYLILQVFVQIAYWGILVLNLLKNNENYEHIMDMNETSATGSMPPKPSRAAALEELKESNEMINTLDYYEGIV